MHTGTSSRTPQKVVPSGAVCHGCSLATIDIGKAFLNGTAYEELARSTSAPSREANVELRAEAVAGRLQFRGYEDFAPCLEVLHWTEPGTGCKGAPRCFAIKLARATNDIFGACAIFRHKHGTTLLHRHKARVRHQSCV